MVSNAPINWSTIPSPIIFQGDSSTAYRDPAAIYHNGAFHLFCTLVTTKSDGKPYWHTAMSCSRDLMNWTPPRIITPSDLRLNFSSPGNVVRFAGQWVLCLQTYPTPRGEKYANDDARLWIMRSSDLETWSQPELLRVKGPDVPRRQMGRMIDAYLLQDRRDPDRWWCLYKQDGMCMSWSRDLTTWHYSGRIDAGENVCAIVDGDEYLLLHSPQNGIGVKRSGDLKTWTDEGLITLGQPDWPWARGRISAGFVIDLRDDPTVGKAILLFHGSGPEDERTMFTTHASLGLAWSDDLRNWHWPRGRA